MVLGHLSKCMWVFFVLPVLVSGDDVRKGETISPGLQEEIVKEEFPTVLFVNEPLPGSLWLLAENIASEHGLSPRLIKSIILTESNGDPQKVSPKGAKGLMQLMPLVIQHYKVLDPLDPVANIRAGVQYLHSLLVEFSGDLHLALAAYNAGPGAVRKYRGIPPFPETEAFVRKVSRLFHSGSSDATEAAALGSRTGREPSGTGFPAKILVNGTPRTLGLFLKQMRMEAEIQSQ